MGKFIVLRPTHITALKKAVRDYMATTKWGTWRKYVSHRTNREDFEPIRFRDDASGERWVLPLSIMQNKKFKKLKEIIESAEISGITIQTLTKADQPTYNLEGATDYTKI